MPITPHFTIAQTLTHIELDIRVPHVRVTPESIQVVLVDNAILHFAAPPYLLILNFAALGDNNDNHDNDKNDAVVDDDDDDDANNNGGSYRFDETASEACATYEPTIENGTIHLSLKKSSTRHCSQTKMWNNLHLLGRLVLPTTTRSKNNHQGMMKKNDMKNPPLTSQWLLEEVVSTTTNSANTNTTTDANEEESYMDENQTSSATKRRRRRPHGYGFAGMFNGVFSDLTRDGLAKEMLECSPDDDHDHGDNELLNIDLDENDESSGINMDFSSSSFASYTARRRIQRRRMENAKFDPDRYRQDLDNRVDDDYIYQCAMAMKPHWKVTPTSVGGGAVCTDGSSDTKDLESMTKRLEALAVVTSEKELVQADDTSSQLPLHGGKNKEQPKQQQQQQQQESFFTEEERLQLVSLPYPLLSPETSLSWQQRQQQNDQHEKEHDENGDDDTNDTNDLSLGILVGLVDLLFAYVYDHLTTDGDATVESAWTVSILSASLSWMEDWQHILTTTTSSSSSNDRDNGNNLQAVNNTVAAAIKEVLYSSLRRALVYPYLRSLSFALHCAVQVADILQHPGGGACCILRCLLQMRSVLNHSELYYLGNKLFIDPYLAWIQKQNSTLLSRRLAEMAQVIRNLVSAFDNVATMEQCKQSLGLDLMCIEQEEEELEDQQHGGDHSSSSSDSDDNRYSSDNSQLDEDDDQSPELDDHNGQHESDKGTAVSSELLDCSLGLSALHIVHHPRDHVETGTLMSPPIVTCKCSTEQQQQQCGELALTSKPKKLVVALND
jgi:SHQ1 protein